MLIFGDWAQGNTACIKTALDVKCPFMMAYVTSGKLKAELWDFQFTLGHFLRVFALGPRANISGLSLDWRLKREQVLEREPALI